MNTDLSQFYEVFFDETAEHLAAMESLLLSININNASDDDLNAIFRAAHSIKGSSGTFGFTDLAEVTHELETLLDRLRKREMVITREMVDAFLEARDVLLRQLDAHRHGGEAPMADAKAIREKLQVLASLPQSDSSAADTGLLQTVDIAMVSPIPLKRTQVIEALSSLGKASLQQMPRQRKGAKPKPWHARLTTRASDEKIVECLSFVMAPEGITITHEQAFIQEHETASQEKKSDDAYGFFSDLPAAADRPAEDSSAYGFFGDTPKPEPVTAPSIASMQNGRRASDVPQMGASPGGRRVSDKAAAVASPEASSIRVSVQKVDQLINLVGELVITQAMLAQTAANADPVAFERLHNGIALLDRNTRDLQESVMSIRMMPMSFVFSRFPRVVRDVASKLGKEVELKTEGEATELDKGLIEKLTDPLTHLVRNSLDHGIEAPDVRLAAGKPAHGTLTLRAFHQGGNIMVEVKDDGSGLNREKILAKARERGIQVSDTMSDGEVYSLIFEAGFSTADVVTDVSGRGVGMDVVRRNIREMGGGVDIASKKGEGTTISIRLPLTLAILDGMSISVGDEIFIIPLAYIVESLQPTGKEIKSIGGSGRLVHVRGEYLPLVMLHEEFHIKSKGTELSQGIVVILEAEGRKAALFVDALLGQHQVVIKNLETNYRRVHGVSGATIMGDGKVALILDAVAMVQAALPTLAHAA